MCKEIPLSRGLVALVDDSDFPRASQYKWCVDRNGYACRMESYFVDGKRKRRKVLLHRFILNAPVGMEVDHKHHDKLDCRRSEMRLVTHAQNRSNSRPERISTSRYKGVYWHKRDLRWIAAIGVGGNKVYLGAFIREEDAAQAYNAAALEAWGEFAFLNTIASPRP